MYNRKPLPTHLGAALDMRWQGLLIRSPQTATSSNALKHLHLHAALNWLDMTYANQMVRKASKEHCVVTLSRQEEDKIIQYTGMQRESNTHHRWMLRVQYVSAAHS